MHVGNQRQSAAEDQQRVRCRGACRDVEHQGGRQHDRGPEANLGVEQTPPQSIRGTHRSHGQCRRPESRGKLAHAKYLVGRHHAPVQQHRLVRAQLIIERGHDPIVTLPHLAGATRIARLVAVPEAGGTQLREERRKRNGQDQREWSQPRHVRGSSHRQTQRQNVARTGLDGV